MITPDLLLDWNACWSPMRVVHHFSRRAALSPREVAADATVALDDRLWVLCRALRYRNKAKARSFAIDSAALVSHLAGRPEDQAEHARLVADLRRIVDFPSEKGAWDAARGAAHDRAWLERVARRDEPRAATALALNAAWDTVRAAGWDVPNTEWGTAWAAARATALAATASRVWDAAWDAARQDAIDHLLVALGADADGWDR